MKWFSSTSALDCISEHQTDYNTTACLKLFISILGVSQNYHQILIHILAAFQPPANITNRRMGYLRTSNFIKKLVTERRTDNKKTNLKNPSMFYCLMQNDKIRVSLVYYSFMYVDSLLHLAGHLHFSGEDE